MDHLGRTSVSSWGEAFPAALTCCQLFERRADVHTHTHSEQRPIPYSHHSQFPAISLPGHLGPGPASPYPHEQSNENRSCHQILMLPGELIHRNGGGTMMMMILNRPRSCISHDSSRILMNLKSISFLLVLNHLERRQIVHRR